jgi:hypothetical protein
MPWKCDFYSLILKTVLGRKIYNFHLNNIGSQSSLPTLLQVLVKGTNILTADERVDLETERTHHDYAHSSAKWGEKAEAKVVPQIWKYQLQIK